MLARFLLSAWFGAATLFVIIGVREVRFPGFDSTIRDQLVLLRFPAYYVCGFAAIGGALLNLMLLLIQGLRRPATYAPAILSAMALGLMAYDYPCIYSPLARMITPPGQARPAEFQQLHHWSQVVNAAQLGCVLAAAVTLCAIDGTTTRLPFSAAHREKG
ncbi:MAG: hypothetical protein JNG89_18420 [Planctomycetaceae bacterium]|nr:hypothetical protein [Planctomycetaceae bacterium]